MQGEEPVLGRDWPAGHGDPTVAGGRGAPGVGAHVVPGRQSWEKRLLAACGVMDALPHQALAGAGGVGLVSPGTRHRQLRVCEDRSPPRRLVLAAAPDARPVGHPGAEPAPGPGWMRAGAEAMAEARPRPARAHPLGGAVEAIRHDAPAPIGRIVRKRGARERLRGLVVRKNYGNDSFVGFIRHIVAVTLRLSF